MDRERRKEVVRCVRYGGVTIVLIVLCTGNIRIATYGDPGPGPSRKPSIPTSKVTYLSKNETVERHRCMYRQYIHA
jgi:hypothetical protein